MDLPYGMKLYYEQPYILENDVLEWNFVEVKAVEYSGDFYCYFWPLPDKQKYILAYYLNQYGEQNGAYTKFYMEKTGTFTKEILFNPLDLKYKTVCPKAMIASNKRKSSNAIYKQRKSDEKLTEYQKKGQIYHGRGEHREISKYTYPQVNEGAFLAHALFADKSWDKCPFTQKFKDKYPESEGILPGYDAVGYAGVWIDENIIQENKILTELRLSNGEHLFVICKTIWNPDKTAFKNLDSVKSFEGMELVDDILVYIVPKDKENLSWDEMYMLAFND